MAEMYYGIAIPPDIENLDPNKQLELKTFYSDKAEVMKVLKEIKMARFKVFRNKEDAILFSGTHVLPANVTVSDSVLLSSPKPSEKCEFKSLKPQEEVKFRKAIEANPSDLSFLMACIEENARYLVTPSDTPTILQHGQRHNALHAAARHGKVEAARLVLAQVTGGLMSRMYPEEDRAQNMRRREFLVDMYLNMPDKGGGDTPLHLAVKFGHLEMVRLLCSYHQTRTDMVNKFGEMAASVVCSRAKTPDPDMEREIREILEGQVVIPVYRVSEGKQLGRPISLREASELLEPRSPEVSARLAADTSVTSDIGSASPLVQSSRARVAASASVPASPLSTSIAAVMGPITPSHARSLYRTWRTGSEGSETQSGARERLGDPVLGAERQGRDLATREGVMWTEWWPWLGDYCDLGSEAGLRLLERHLERRTREAQERLDMEYQEDIEEDLESSITANQQEDEVFSGELEIVTRVSSSTPAKTRSWSAYRSSSEDDSLDNGVLDNSQLDHSLTDKNGNTTKSGREPLSPLSSLMSGFDNMNLASGSNHQDSRDTQSQELANLTTPPTKLQHSLSNDVMRTMEQFVSSAVTLLVDSVPDTEHVTPECAGDLDWVRPLASHWSVLRRQVNNWRSDPANRWAGLDWPGVGGTLVEMMGDQITLELGTGLERERLAKMMEVVARTEEADTEDRAEEHEESYERGRRKRVTEARSGARDVSRLCHLVSSVLLSPSCDPDPLEAAGLWELDTGKSCVRTSNVNRARRFLHSGSTSSTQSESVSDPPEPLITSSCHQPIDPGYNRRDSLSSQSSQESQGAWLTPPTSPGASSVASMETCSEGLGVWVQGEGPSVQDRRLAEALAHVSQPTLATFPHVSWYLAHVSSFTKEQQRQWTEAEAQSSRQYGGLARKLDLDFTI